MNKCFLKGNLTRDPETRYVGSDNKSVTTFGIAVNRTYGEKEPDFFDIECWNGRGETIAEYFKKGDEILLECQARQDTWETDEGNRSKVKFVVDQFYFTRGKKRDEETASAKPAKSNKKTQKVEQTESNDSGDDDVPF